MQERDSQPQAEAEVTEVDFELLECKKEIEQLRTQLAEMQKCDSKLLASFCKSQADSAQVESKSEAFVPIRLRRNLVGHVSKIFALDWGDDEENLLTASMDCNLILWNPQTSMKRAMIPLRSQHVMACALGDGQQMLASAGMDNIVSIFQKPAQNEWKGICTEVHCELQAHEAYVSSVAFAAANIQVLSASGDGTAIMWDLETRTPVTVFVELDGDNEDLCDLDFLKEGNLIATGGVDALVKVWDIRQKGDKAVMRFSGHGSDVNSVRWFADGKCVVSGSEDATCRLFDMRSVRELNVYALDSQMDGYLSVDRTHSGSHLFAAHENGVHVWDALTGDCSYHLPHDSRVSALKMAPTGACLATASWDFRARVFA